MVSNINNDINTTIQEIVFNVQHDDALRQAVRAGKTPEDACDISTIKEAMDRLDEVVKAASAKDGSGVEELPAAPAAPEPVPEPSTLTIDATQIMIQQVQVVTKNDAVPDESKQLIANHEIKATRLLDTNVMFAKIPNSAKKVREILDAAGAGKIRGNLDAGTSVGILLDPAQMGECVSSPHLRVNPVNHAVVRVLSV